MPEADIRAHAVGNVIALEIATAMQAVNVVLTVLDAQRLGILLSNLASIASTQDADDQADQLQPYTARIQTVLTAPKGAPNAVPGV